MSSTRVLFLAILLLFPSLVWSQCQIDNTNASNSSGQGCTGTVTFSATSISVGGFSNVAHEWFSDVNLTNGITQDTAFSPTQNVWVSEVDLPVSQTTTLYVRAVCDGTTSAAVPVEFVVNNDPIDIGTGGEDPTNVCEGDNSFELSAQNTSSTSSFTWKFSTDVTNPPDNNDPVISADSTYQPDQGTGYYYLTATNNCGDEETTSIEVVISPALGSLFTPGDNGVCQGDTSRYRAFAANAGSYDWQIANATVAVDYEIIPTAFSDSLIVVWDVGYANTATITVEAEGCANTKISDSFDVIVSASPPATITPMGSTTIPLGANSMTLSANTGAGLSYQWYMDGMALEGETGSMFNAFMAGSYTVGVTRNGCETISSPTVVTTANNHNYVLARTLQIAQTNGTPVSEAELPTLSSDQKNETITYLDGLGRPMQQVAWQSSPGTQDQINHAAYDERGRKTQQYLPYVSGNNGYFRSGADNATVSYYQDSGNPAKGIVQDSEPYAETDFEDSPLSRVAAQGAPGADFQPITGQAITFGYPTNEANQIKRWRLNTSELPFQDATYPAGRHTIQEMTDEDGRVTRTYTDRLGRSVLKRQVANTAGTDFQDTYYIYDQFNRLRYVLPPEGSEAYTTANQTLLDRWAFQYRYDERGNMTEKRVPGAEWQYMIYDQRDRLILSQDGRQRQEDEWTFTHYDALNRPVVEGLYASTNTYAQMLTAVDNHLVTSPENNAAPVGKDELAHLHGAPTLVLNTYEGHSKITASESVTLQPGFEVDFRSAGPVHIKAPDSSPTSPSNGAFPALADSEVLKLHHYDHYDFDQEGTADYTYDAAGIPADINPYANVQGQPTGTTVRVLDQDAWLTTAMFYDDKGRVIQTQSRNHIGGGDKVTTEYSFHGLMLRQWHHQASSNAWGDEDLTVLTRHEYDQTDRLTHVHQTVGDEDEQLLAYHEYNELGQLVDKGLHEVTPNPNGPDTYCQSIDYRYTIRGWLEFINQNSLAEGGIAGSQINAGADLFGQQFAYDDPVTGLTGQQPQFNGNISAVTWNSSELSQPGAYAYGYDLVNRLTTADHFSNGSPTLSYDVSNISYDKNGNINSLLRRGDDGSVMDNLDYDYLGNQLTSVEELPGSNPAVGFVDGSVNPQQYEYDLSGNLTVDRNKDIAAISYNHLNLPEAVTFGNSDEIRYTYDATGTKLKQEVETGGTVTSETDYVAGRQYKDGALDLLMHAEGRTKFGATGFTQHYDIKDHLGNVRLTFASEETLTTFAATMESGGNLAMREEAYFEGIDDSRRALAYHNASPPSSEEPTPNKVATLNAAKGRVKGPAKSLRVHPGDSIHIEVLASYEEHSRKKVKGGSGVLAAVSTLFSPVAAGVEVAGASEGINEALAGTTLLDRDKTGVPKAYLNYVVMNEEQVVIDQGFMPVSEAAKIETGRRGYGKRKKKGKKKVIAGDSVAHETLAVDLDIEEEGYLYTYVSNESNWDVDVHFDQMAVAASSAAQPVIVQSNDFFPFGLSHQQPLNNPANKYLFNGKELQSELGLNIYDYIARNYDPATGRFWQVDPAADLMTRFSPYSYAFDNPIRFTDPDGMMPSDPNCPECPGSEAQQIANVMAATVSDGLTGLYNLTIGRVNNTVADNSADGVRIQINERQAPTTLLEAATGPVVDALNASALVTGGSSSTGGLVAKTGAKAGLKNTAADVVEGAVDNARPGAFKQAKRDAGVPVSQQPGSVERVKMTDRNGSAILDAGGNPINTREYHFKNNDGQNIVIQDHSAGHNFGGVGDRGPHFNVRPIENTRTGKVPGTRSHYEFIKRQR